MATINWSLQHKRDTAANWTANNPTLLAGQIGIETDNLTTTPKFKIGDGSTAWNTLPYFYGGALSAQNLSNVLSVGSSTSGQDMTITADDQIKFGSGNAVIFNDSTETDPNHVIISSNPAVAGYSHIFLANGNNQFHDDSASGYISLQVGSPPSCSISLDQTNNGKINIYNGIGGLNFNNDTYFPSLTASRLLSLDANNKVVNETGTGFLKLNAGVISYDSSTYLTSISGLNISLLNNDSGYITSSALSPYLTVSGAALAYQPLDSDLTSWAGVTRYSGFDTFVASPSSANLASLVTDETGSGSLVFGTAPTLSNLTLDRLHLTGNISASAWTTSGIGIRHTARTITDTTSSGTVAAAYTNLLGGNTIAASNSTTFSDYYSTYISSPSAGTNVTFTRSWSLGLSGNLDIGGNIRIGGVTSTGVTGSGALVFGTSPSFTTDITTPLIIGGSAVGSTIQYKGTSGNGTSTVAAHQFLVGNNGATTAAQIFNSGQVNIGNYASPTNLRLVTIGQDTAYMSFGSLVGTTSQPAIYLNQATPSATNYTITSDGSNVYLNTQSTTGFCYITTGNNTRFYFGRSGMASNFAADISGATTTFSFIIPAHTGQTASNEITNFKVTGNTKTWAAGAISTQRWNYFTANTAAFASASTISESIALAVEAATAGSNATITNNFSLGLSHGTGSVKIGNLTGSTSISAIYLNQGSPSNANASIYSTGSQTNLNDATTVVMSVGTSNRIVANNTSITFSASAATSAAISTFTFSAPNNTGQTASTEINGYLYNSYSRQWNTGAITTQRERYYKTVTYSFVGASTITNAYGAYFEAPTAGSNCTITSNWSAGFSGSVEIINGRLVRNQGADVASANNLVLGTDGNVFEITGTTQINLISNIGWKNGAMITLLFTSTPTVKHNQATSTTNITIQLAGAADFVATAGDTLTLVLSEIGGTQAWREVSRAVI